MNIETFQNCTENGEIFSCFFKIGAVENMTDCEDRCRSKNLFAFNLDDFYNFADRLNQSNYLSSEISTSLAKSKFQQKILVLKTFLNARPYYMYFPSRNLHFLIQIKADFLVERSFFLAPTSISTSNDASGPMENI